MSALPCINSLAADLHAARMGHDAAREAAVEALIPELESSYQFDVEILSDAFADVAGTVGEYDKRNRSNDPRAAQFLTAAFNGTDDAACMQLIRQVMREYIRSAAENEAENKVWGSGA